MTALLFLNKTLQRRCPWRRFTFAALLCMERTDTLPIIGEQALAFTTTEDLRSTLAACASPVSGSVDKPDWRLYLTESSVRQTVTGFGAAWTDATIAVFSSLPESAQTQLMSDLFSVEGGGIGLGLMRHTVGQSDLSPRWIGTNGKWSYDEVAGDESLNHFNLSTPGFAMAKYLGHMFALNPDATLLGSVWSPPTWMKQNNILMPRYYDVWVQYMLKYLQAFEVNRLARQRHPSAIVGRLGNARVAAATSFPHSGL